MRERLPSTADALGVAAVLLGLTSAVVTYAADDWRVALGAVAFGVIGVWLLVVPALVRAS